jgi:hypothetical protein
MIELEIRFTGVDDIHKAAELAKIVTESGEPVLVSHRPTSPGKTAYRKWFGGGLADAGLIEKDIREGCRY